MSKFRLFWWPLILRGKAKNAILRHGLCLSILNKACGSPLYSWPLMYRGNANRYNIAPATESENFEEIVRKPPEILFCGNMRGINTRTDRQTDGRTQLPLWWAYKRCLRHPFPPTRRSRASARGRERGGSILVPVTRKDE